MCKPLLPVVDQPVSLLVKLEYRPRLICQQAMNNLDTAGLQVLIGLRKDRSFLKPDGRGISAPCPANDPSHPAPQGGPEAHGTWCAGCHQFVGREVGCTQRVRFKPLLRPHEGYDLGMEYGVPESFDPVHSCGYEVIVRPSKDGGAEGPTRPVHDVFTGQGDHEAHLVLVSVARGELAERIRNPTGKGDTDFRGPVKV